jgi:hypothetical protein
VTVSIEDGTDNPRLALPVALDDLGHLAHLVLQRDQGRHDTQQLR